jgi:hypothetical protein
MRELFGNILLLAEGILLGFFLFSQPVVSSSSFISVENAVCSSSTPSEFIDSSFSYSFLGETVREGVISNYSLGTGEGFFEVWRFPNGSFVKREIWVSDNLTESRKLVVLAHEYGHVVQFERGWNSSQLNASEEGSKAVLEALIK